MAWLIVEHEVKDAQAWRPGFDAHATTRNKYGLKNTRVYTQWGKPNTVCVILEGDADKIKGFLNDPTLKPEMEKDGVIGAPRINVMDALTATH
jgi:hypothetical protein